MTWNYHTIERSQIEEDLFDTLITYVNSLGLVTVTNIKIVENSYSRLKIIYRT